MIHAKNIAGKLLWTMLFIVLAVASCTKYDEPVIKGVGTRRTEVPAKCKVLLLYSAGFNSLSSQLEADVDDMASGYLPLRNSAAASVLVYSRRLTESRRYTDPAPSYLIRLSRDAYGNVLRDTLKTWPKEMVAASVKAVNEVLTSVKELYPNADYGMIFSSHGTGWLPSGYYSSGTITNIATALSPSAGLNYDLVPVPYREFHGDDQIKVKSIGADNINSSEAYEMNIEDFAAAIPMKLDYMIIDACLMGGVEVAYALRNKCDKLVFSQAEVLADGLCDYNTVAKRLLLSSEPDLLGVCSDSWELYSSQSVEWRRSLTISMVDCTRLSPLAEACRKLFSEHQSEIMSVWPDDVQGYFRFSKHWFYDLEDILVKARIPESDLEDFRNAMNGCILYKNASVNFLLDFTIKTFCGLSMYLPSDGNATLNEFYKTLSWNVDTGLVR